MVTKRTREEINKYEHIEDLNAKRVVIGDGANIDSFARLRVSNPLTLFDSKNIFDNPDLLDSQENQPLFYDNQEVSGTGTSTLYENNKAHTVLSVSNLTAGKRIRQTKQRFNYQPGKSLLIFMTFVMCSKNKTGIISKEGYYDENNGIYLMSDENGYAFIIRSNTTGTPTETIVRQSEWNLNTFEDLDCAKTQILIIDLEWLGVGRVRVGFVINGIPVYCHEFNHANIKTEVYMSTPNLPLRSEIENDGTGEQASLTQICSTVISEGGQDKLGLIRHVSNVSLVSATTAGTTYALIGIRLHTNYLALATEILNVALQITGASKQGVWKLLFNPTIAGTFTFNTQTFSGIEVAYGATANTITGGVEIGGGFIESGANASGANGSTNSNISNALKLGSTIAGVSDVIVLAFTPFTSSTDIRGSLTWRELS
jgi:hypothetical protein